MTTGSWNLHKAIVSHWSDSDLDDQFKAYWDGGLHARYPALIDTEQRPSGPFPYCVYTVEQPITTGNSTGVSDPGTTRKYVTATVQFDIHAKSTSAMSGKDIANALAQSVAGAYDPGNDWGIETDWIMKVERTVDHSVREEDDKWLWTLIYEVQLDQSWSR